MDDIVHAGAARATVLTAILGGSTSDLTIMASPPLTGWPQPTGDEVAVLILNKTGSTPEKILYSDINIATGEITVWNSGLSTGRAYDGTSIAQHFTGEAVEHCWTATEADALVEHVNSTEAHGSDGNVVGQNTLDAVELSLQAEITAASALAIPKSIIDAAGDIIVGTADNTPARLALGAAGTVPTSNGTTVAYAVPAVGFVASYALSGATSQSLAEDTFVAGYDYEISVVGTSLADGVETFRMRVGGVDDSSANYSQTVIADATLAVKLAGQTSGRLTSTDTAATGETIVVYAPADAVFTTVTGNAVFPDASDFAVNLDTANVHRVASAFDSMTFFWSSAFTGTLTVKRLRRT